MNAYKTFSFNQIDRGGLCRHYSVSPFACQAPTLARYADKIAVVVYGEVLAFDTPEAVRANAKVQEAYLGSSVADSQAGGH